jgi:hypothetical protein
METMGVFFFVCAQVKDWRPGEGGLRRDFAVGCWRDPLLTCGWAGWNGMEWKDSPFVSLCSLSLVGLVDLRRTSFSFPFLSYVVAVGGYGYGCQDASSHRAALACALLPVFCRSEGVGWSERVSALCAFLSVRSVCSALGTKET